MSNATKILIGILLLIIMSIASIALYVLNTYNMAVKFENNIQAVYDNNRNIMANSYYGPLEAAGLGEKKYKEMMIQMVEAVGRGYQGATGGKAMMLWLGQTQPTMTHEMQLKFVSIAEKGLAKLEGSQTDLIARGNVYNDFLGTEPRGSIARFMGFPKVDLKKILTPVTDNQTEQSFETKRRAPIPQ